MNCVPTRLAYISRAAMRATMLLARSSSGRCEVGTKRSPSMLLRLRTGGGPPSFESGDSKKREMENVLHGGAATMTANSPRATRSRRGS